MNFDLVHVVRFCTRELERFSIELCMRGYQVCKGIWEASFGEELPYRRDNGEVRASLFGLIIDIYYVTGIGNGIKARHHPCNAWKGGAIDSRK